MATMTETTKTTWQPYAATERATYVATPLLTYRIEPRVGGYRIGFADRPWSEDVDEIPDSLRGAYNTTLAALRILRAHDVADARSMPDGTIRVGLHCTDRDRRPLTAFEYVRPRRDELRAVLGY